MRLKKPGVFILIFTALGLLSIAAYNLPPIHSRLAWRVDRLRTQVKYALNPPEQVVFVPQGMQSQGAQATMSSIVAATLTALVPTPTATLPPTEIPTPGPTATLTPSPTPTPVPTPIPERVALKGIVHEYEQMNNCGPATLAMNLSYWGWKGDQIDTRAFLRPNREVDDKNVMPEEMARYVQTQTGFKALVRAGGNVELLKRLVAGGFPVIIEKGFQPGKEAWMGHYTLVSGYDDGRGRVITQDSYIMPDLPVKYADLDERWWRDFNYAYLVVFPPEREAEVLALLGPEADPAADLQIAYQKAVDESEAMSGRDQFFAWYNRGTSLVGLQDYAAAAQAYDQAFALYPSIPEKDRPWRLLWYQTGPYAAYYATGRYQDVINLADTTFQWIGDPILEETYYWRGMAYAALGNLDQAVSDLRQAVHLNPDSTPARDELLRLGF